MRDADNQLCKLYGTGSSAITNYLEEFENCKSLSDYEFRFLYDPDGVSDLEFHIVENHHRHNSGYALKRYEKFAKQLGNPYFKNMSTILTENGSL